MLRSIVDTLFITVVVDDDYARSSDCASRRHCLQRLHRPAVAAAAPWPGAPDRSHPRLSPRSTGHPLSTPTTALAPLPLPLLGLPWSAAADPPAGPCSSHRPRAPTTRRHRRRNRAAVADAVAAAERRRVVRMGKAARTATFTAGITTTRRRTHHSTTPCHSLSTTFTFAFLIYVARPSSPTSPSATTTWAYESYRRSGTACPRTRADRVETAVARDDRAAPLPPPPLTPVAPRQRILCVTATQPYPLDFGKPAKRSGHFML
mmetsp:Transcript_5526/g.17920  ORF Transcript_5526/g.17920 Transcript_5526/m.17920 type:complete len:262 (-) Transcript_5526:400-1185(-)